MNAMARDGIRATGDTREDHLAATVMLLRDSDDGPEVLLLERPRASRSFPGAWVFPGGSVDPEDREWDDGDSGDEALTRRAAVREVREETSLEISPDALVKAACWIPPTIAPKRYRTWFYAARAPATGILLSQDEAVAFEWLRPAEALRRHAEGVFELVPPTWVMLHRMTLDDTVDAVLTRTGARAEEFATHAHQTAAGPVMLWAGDIAYDDEDLLEREGPRHRLDIRVLPWVYTRTSHGPTEP